MLLEYLEELGGRHALHAMRPLEQLDAANVRRNDYLGRQRKDER